MILDGDRLLSGDKCTHAAYLIIGLRRSADGHEGRFVGSAFKANGPIESFHQLPRRQYSRVCVGVPGAFSVEAREEDLRKDRLEIGGKLHADLLLLRGGKGIDDSVHRPIVSRGALYECDAWRRRTVLAPMAFDEGAGEVERAVLAAVGSQNQRH